MPKQLSMVIQPLPRWYKCAHAWGAGQAVGLKPWVKPWAPGLFVFQKSSLSSPRGAHLCEFGKILVAELPSREEKWRKVTLARRHHRQNFPRTRTIEPAWRSLRSDIVLSLRTADAFPVVASSDDRKSEMRLLFAGYTQGLEEMCLSLEHQSPSKTSEKMGSFDRVTVSLHIL